MQRVFLTVLVLLAATCSASEETTKPSGEDYTDVVLLNNNGTITGKIVEIIPGKEVRIERIDGQEFKVPYKKIFAVTDTEHLEERRQELAMAKPPKTPIEWENITLIGFRHWDDKNGFTASSTNGAMLGDRVYLGLGIGCDDSPEDERSWSILLFADGRYHINWGSTRPFAFVDAGYGKGGPLFGAGLGMRLAVDDGAMPLLQIGYRRQEKEYGTIDGQDVITAMIGIVF